MNVCHLPKGELKAFITWFKQDECFIPSNKSGDVMEGFCCASVGLRPSARPDCAAGGGAKVLAVLSTSNLSSEQSHVWDLWGRGPGEGGGGGLTQRQSTKPLLFSSEKDNRGQIIVHSADGGGSIGCRTLPRPLEVRPDLSTAPPNNEKPASWLLLHIKSFDD